MIKNFNELRKSPLFHDISDDQLTAMLGCLDARDMHYEKGQHIFTEGDPATNIGLILSGSAQVVQIDYYGNRSIVTTILPSELFGESFACAGVDSLPINIVATEDSDVLLIDCKRITTTCCNSCSFHNQIIYNLMKIVATKNLMFNQKISITSKRSTKAKLIAYLLNEAKKNQSDFFTIPYDRQELADYLGVERSGLSSEIGKLHKSGLIEVNKNVFKLSKDLTY